MIPVSIERVVHNGGVATKEEEMMYVDIPPGTDAREMIVYRGKGNINPNGDQGDIKIFVTIEEHPTFERRGLDLIYRHKISLREALCGFHLILNT
jgi:DnaJ-class molecular chaperone